MGQASNAARLPAPHAIDRPRPELVRVPSCHGPSPDNAVAQGSIERLLADPASIAIHFQPIVDLRTGETHAFEALARFERGRPDSVFADAWSRDLGLQMELKAISCAFGLLERLPVGTTLGVNLSPETLISEEFSELLDAIDPRRIVAEITEHEAIRSLATTKEAFDRVLDRGVRLGLDDLGAGYSTLAHVIELSPDVLKLDRVLVRDIDEDPVRRALVRALLAFAKEVDALVVAEGVESEAELDALRAMGLRYAQGFHVGRPLPIDRLI